ncbi:MAG: protein kinase [Planctomycetes bacterium]|nr:protein kinase [Planctomycetota bacterium]
MDAPQDAHPVPETLSSHADELFAAHLVRHPSSDDAAFDELVRANPEHRVELEELRSGWLRVAGVLLAQASFTGDGSLRAASTGHSGPPRYATEGSESEFTRALMDTLGRRAGTFARYTHVAEVARGSQGAIEQVWEEDLRRHLAMKRLLRLELGFEGAPPVDPSPKPSRRLARFLAEAQVTGQLSHPGIPPVHELGLDDHGWPFFTMPLVRGRTLAEALREHHADREPWTSARFLGVLLKACDAVAYAHSKGVVHRDLKPSNLMLGRYGEVYVMDWGLAHVAGRGHQPDVRLQDLPLDPGTWVRTDRADSRPDGDSALFTMDGDVVGTPAYMSPEQAAGNLAEISERSDVYALGAMLYHFLAGGPPYADGEQRAQRDVVGRILSGPPTPLRALAPGAPAELVAVCERAMAYSSARRYVDVAALAEDLHAYLDLRPVSAHAPGLWHTLKLAVRRHAAVSTTAAIAAGVLLAASLVFVVRLSSSEAAAQLRADVNQSAVLRGSTDELYPALPSEAPRIRAWLGAVDALLARREAYDARRAATPSGPEAEPLRTLCTELTALAAVRPSVAGRLDEAQRIERVSLVDAAERWREASAAIAASPAYGGLVLAPQLGLVPLEENPHSGLWEFWHVASGARPERDEAGEDGDRWRTEGAYRIEEDSGMVLVLVPGGLSRQGHDWSTEPDDGTKSEFAVRREIRERPFKVDVEPFFLSKYELTQGQYLAVFEVNPSAHQRGWPDRAEPCDDRHPVENLDWDMAADAARRLDLVLPSEI